MSRAAALRPLLPLLFCLPLIGCAAGYGNYGPGGLRDRIGERSRTTYSDAGRPGYLRKTTYRWKESSSWAGALAFGASMGRSEASLTGMRDTTYERAIQWHSDIVVNAANDMAAFGLTIGYFSTDFEGSPVALDYSGITLGPMVFLRVMPFISVDGSIARVFGSLKDRDGYYFKPVFNFMDSKQPLPGWRREAHVNLIPIRTEELDLGIRVGYQITETEEKQVYAMPRKFKSQGPIFELLAFVF